jgi:hypothetical protein
MPHTAIGRDSYVRLFDQPEIDPTPGEVYRQRQPRRAGNTAEFSDDGGKLLHLHVGAAQSHRGGARRDRQQQYAAGNLRGEPGDQV